MTVIKWSVVIKDGAFLITILYHHASVLGYCKTCIDFSDVLFLMKGETFLVTIKCLSQPSFCFELYIHVQYKGISACTSSEYVENHSSDLIYTWWLWCSGFLDVRRQISCIQTSDTFNINNHWITNQTVLCTGVGGGAQLCVIHI